ncbi:MAG: triose-phosphate isomerase [Deltaproteobacteria bacterium]|nr:triose-phosphate isomerase [Deltaproteobacteria bacterium]
MTHSARRPLIAGNWKMHNSLAESVALARAVADVRIGPRTDVVVAPVFTALSAVAQALVGTPVGLAGQDLHWEPKGAFTGAISAPMLKDVGCSHVIIGHSERRQYFGETDESVRNKTLAALRSGLTPIVCVGETLAEREGGITFEVIGRQLDAVLNACESSEIAAMVIAYEPVWAIGTGRTAKSSDAQLAHAFLRDRARHKHAEAADRTRVLYGGSVKADNAAELLAQPDIDGALVGGASLDAETFGRIIRAAG